MKKLVYVTAVCLSIASLGGCNRSWPSFFCNREPDYPVMDSCDVCDPCTENYYMPSTGEVEWIPQDAAPQIDSLPTPGPDTGA